MTDAQAAPPPAWRLDKKGGTATLHLEGNWLARTGEIAADLQRQVLDQASGASQLVIEADKIGSWDSGLVVFVEELRLNASEQGLRLDENSLPAPLKRLLHLADAGLNQNPASPKRAKTLLLSRIGAATIGLWTESVAVAALLGGTILRGGAAVSGRSRLRWADLIVLMQDAGARALVIVAIVNILVGGILAFVGAIQLQRFGAQIYVANLVGIAVVREMAAIMTAIVMAGRTGGAYAAEIATMQGNEEIDALVALGIPVDDYLILPRVTALTAMMPVLYVYGCAFGLLGGFVVAMATTDISAAIFWEHTRTAIDANQFIIGLSKSVVFGALVALAGCRLGLKAGRSAADVGRAATSAVVVSIVGVIAVDAVFAVCANALGV